MTCCIGVCLQQRSNDTARSTLPTRMMEREPPIGIGRLGAIRVVLQQCDDALILRTFPQGVVDGQTALIVGLGQALHVHLRQRLKGFVRGAVYAREMHGQVSKFRLFRRRSVRVGLEKCKDYVERSAGSQGNVYGISAVWNVSALHALRAIFDDGTNDGFRSIQSTCLMDGQARPFALTIGCQFRLDPVGLTFSQHLVSNRGCNGRIPLFLHDIAGQFAEAMIKHCLVVFHGEGDKFFTVFFAVFGSFGGYGHCVACFHEFGDGRFVWSRNLHRETLRGATSKI
mmetsp:Transcript_23173/g.35766  ORF Transcript_23173/g.35766 Transcript_23173/m.35766 type:complete len:284 (+) Transcript_23173:1453-2304(+)